MIFPSHSSPVPPFHSLESGTVEQTLNQWNNQRNRGGTSSLKALANNVLERNKDWNKPGTVASKSVPPMLQSSSACGTKSLLNVPRPVQHEIAHETKNGSMLGDIASHLSSLSALHLSSVMEDYEERLAIAEYDGQQPPLQAERIAYLDALISVLTTLPEAAYENSPGEDWLDARITAAKEWLQAQNLFQPQ